MRYGLRVIALLAGGAMGAAQQKPAVPEILNPPGGETLLMSAHAVGEQVYTCKAKAWQLKEPDAKLFDASGKQIGRHFAGPSWELNDGSVVKGKLVASALSTDADAIPWLLIAAVEHQGSGPMSKVSSIQRVNTKGGKAKYAGCDATPGNTMQPGALQRVPYSADYLFYTRAR